MTKVDNALLGILVILTIRTGMSMVNAINGGWTHFVPEPNVDTFLYSNTKLDYAAWNFALAVFLICLWARKLFQLRQDEKLKVLFEKKFGNEMNVSNILHGKILRVAFMWAFLYLLFSLLILLAVWVPELDTFGIWFAHSITYVPILAAYFPTVLSVPALAPTLFPLRLLAGEFARRAVLVDLGMDDDFQQRFVDIVKDASSQNKFIAKLRAETAVAAKRD